MDVLKNRNFLLLFLGRIFTNIGDSLYYVAAMWLVYELSGNPFLFWIGWFPYIITFCITISYWSIR